jgi:hypothetical protein
MAKNSIRDYSATSSLNTDVQSVDISEGCAASGINNAIREVMADLKDVSSGTIALETPSADQLNVDNIRIDGNTISSTDTNGDITLDPDGTGNLIVSSNNVAIDSNGRVSINETGTYNDANEFLLIKNTDGAANLSIVADNAQHSTLNLGDEDDFNVGRIRYQHSDNSMRFHTADLERLRIDSSGNLLVGQSSTINPGQGNNTFGSALLNSGRLFLSADGTYSLGLNRSDTGELTNFSRAGSFKGSISINASSVSYNTTSDHRLKQNVVDMTGAIDRVKTLAPKRFDFISDAGNTVDGFLAHEAQAVVPEAVTGTHNEVDDDGNPVMQGIDQSKLVPLLTGALRETIAKIEALETSNADLTARIEALETA